MFKKNFTFSTNLLPIKKTKSNSLQNYTLHSGTYIFYKYFSSNQHPWIINSGPCIDQPITNILVSLYMEFTNWPITIHLSKTIFCCKVDWFTNHITVYIMCHFRYSWIDQPWELIHFSFSFTDRSVRSAAGIQSWVTFRNRHRTWRP